MRLKGREKQKRGICPSKKGKTAIEKPCGNFNRLNRIFPDLSPENKNFPKLSSLKITIPTVMNKNISEEQDKTVSRVKKDKE